MKRTININFDRDIKELLQVEEYDFLHILIQEGHARLNGNDLTINVDLVTKMKEKELRSLDLPSRFNEIFSCKSTGTLLKNSYEIITSFKSHSGKPLGRAEIDGCFVEFGKKRFTLPYEIYKSVQLIDDINEESDTSSKLIKLAQLKEFLSIDNLKSDNVLFNTEVIVADKFTFDLVDEKSFDYVPCFVDLDEGDIVDLLDEQQQKRYGEQFLAYHEVKDKAQVSLNQFVVIPPETKKLLNIVKQTLNSNVSEKRSLFLNPKSYFKEILGDSYDDNNVFIQTENYISKRISHIGVWEPKTQVFLPKGENEWFPKDSVGITLNNQFVFVKTEKIDDVVEKLGQAINQGKSTIQVDGQSINATKENLEIFESVQTKVRENNEKSIKDSYGNEKASPEKVVAIVRDNLEGETYEEVNERGAVEIFIPSILKTKSLYDHQKEGVRWLQESWNNSKRGVLLADDMGLGKTLQTLTFLAWLKELKDSGVVEKLPVLIVGPTGLLKNWQDEHNTHLSGNGLGTLTEGFGSNLSKMRKRGIKYAVDELFNSDWVLTTYDSLALYENIFRRVSWQVIVFDECQAIKNPSSFRTDMAKAMASDFSIGITGTPVENRLSDLWCISDTLFPGLLGTYKSFKDDYEKTDENLQELTYTIKEKEPPPFMLRRMKEDHLTGLTRKDEIIVKEIMPPSQCAIYETVLQSVKTDKYRKAPMLAIQHLKAASLIPEFNNDTSDTEFINSSGRLIALFKILDELKGKEEKVLIFLESRKLQEKLIPLIQRKYNLKEPPLLINGAVSGKIRKSRVDIFQNLPDGFNVMIVSPKAGGTGLTLTQANNVIHLERWWNPAVEDQCSDRVYRIGQKKDVKIFIPMAIHPQEKIKSFDVILHELLTSKRELSRQVIVPTAFTSKDHRDMFERATGKEFEVNDKDPFYKSQKWRDLRYRVLSKYGHKCQLCGATKNQHTLHVDHIKPRSKYPELELDFDNLQVLCEVCNMGKSNRYEDDFRG